MPSIPQSLLWISLVVLWLFVLVPMLINKRDTVRRTSDVALSTRVLNGGKSRLLRRNGPAAGHRSDPDWQGDATLDDEFQEYEAEDYEQAVQQAVREAEEVRVRSHTRTVMVVASVTEEVAGQSGGPALGDSQDYLDVDVVEEDSGALPAGVQESLFEETAEPESVSDPVADPVSDPASEPVADESDEGSGVGDTYEYVDDTSGLEAELDADDVAPVASGASRRRRMESTTAAAVSARKYRFRKRVLMAMAAALVASAAVSVTVSSDLWWACGAVAAVMVLYLAYLRRQTRIEEQVRRRRQQRMARMRAAEEGVDSWVADRGVDVPSRLNRPGAVVLDIDDEDPVFEHLDEVAYSRRYDLPRAAGQ